MSANLAKTFLTRRRANLKTQVHGLYGIGGVGGVKIGNLLSEKRRKRCYIMHMSYNGSKQQELWEFAKNNDVIGLDFPRYVKDNWLRVREWAMRFVGKTWTRQFDVFCSEMGAHDIVLVLKGWDSLLGVAEIADSEHTYDESLSKTEQFFDHTRRVEWIKAYEYEDAQPLPKPLRGFNNALSKVMPQSKRWKTLTNINI